MRTHETAYHAQAVRALVRSTGFQTCTYACNLHGILCGGALSFLMTCLFCCSCAVLTSVAPDAAHATFLAFSTPSVPTAHDSLGPWLQSWPMPAEKQKTQFEGPSNPRPCVTIGPQPSHLWVSISGGSAAVLC